MASFDDLFNDFFNRKKINFGDENNNNNNDLNKIVDALLNFKMKTIQDNFGGLEDSIEKELGEPTEIIEHVEDGFLVKKLIWKTQFGQFVKVLISEIGEEPKVKKVSKSLEEQLKEAVENEDYELAIKLRDEIKKNTKKKTRKKL